LWFEVRQSHYLLVFIVAIHILAIIIMVSVSMIIQLKAIILILLVYSFYLYIQRYKQGNYMFTLRQTSDLSWEVEDHLGFKGIRILQSSVLTSFIIILHVESENNNSSLLICSDAVSLEAYRQLLVALKITSSE